MQQAFRQHPLITAVPMPASCLHVTETAHLQINNGKPFYLMVRILKFTTMKTFWNERYASEEFVYGKAPNEFFKACIDKQPPGKLLLPCEGEGRNAVYAATIHWQVDAFDQSETGKEKCAQLAASKNVIVNYQVAEALEYNFGENQYDVIALIYAHFPANIRTQIHQNCVKVLKPGGVIILEAFNPRQLHNTSGGPKDETMLYTSEMLREDFDHTKIELLETLQTNLQEGEYHSGLGDIIRLVAKKQI